MAGVNKVILVGNLGDDPESRSLNNGGEVVNLRVATSENWKDKDGNRQERTEWHNVVIFNENLAKIAEGGAEAVAERGGGFDEEEAWDVVAEIPTDTAGLLVLLEHRWAIPLRDAIARAGGFRLASEFISPLDLVAIGLVSAEEAEALESADSGAV